MTRKPRKKHPLENIAPQTPNVVDTKEPNKVNPLHKLIAASVLLIFLVAGGCSSFVTIDAGHRGVVTKFGQVEDRVLPEGLSFRWPIMEEVHEIEVRTQKYEVGAGAASKDLQETKTGVALNYHISPTTVHRLYQSLGMDYRDRFIAPAVQEIVKATTAKFNAEELVTKRAAVREQIESGLRDRLTGHGITIDAFAITNFQFSKGFEDAIEAKVTSQQEALKAENDLRRIEVEARQVVAVAEGAAKAVVLKADAEARAIAAIQRQLAGSPNYTNYLAVTRWNGVLPQVNGTGATPFVDLRSK